MGTRKIRCIKTTDNNNNNNFSYAKQNLMSYTRNNLFEKSIDSRLKNNSYFIWRKIHIKDKDFYYKSESDLNLNKVKSLFIFLFLKLSRKLK
jgi:hypothetical protein